MCKTKNCEPCDDELICGPHNGGNPGCGTKGWRLESGAIQFGCDCGGLDDDEEPERVEWSCVSCGFSPIRDSEEHDHCKCDPYDEDAWYCAGCPVQVQKCDMCGGQNDPDCYDEPSSTFRCSFTHKFHMLCDDCIPPDDICSVEQWNERWTKKGKNTFDFDQGCWKIKKKKKIKFVVT